jgi:hypothetical protein
MAQEWTGPGTRVYGQSDDLIEFEGDLYGGFGHYGSDDEGLGDVEACCAGPDTQKQPSILRGSPASNLQACWWKS